MSDVFFFVSLSASFFWFVFLTCSLCMLVDYILLLQVAKDITALQPNLGEVSDVKYVSQDDLRAMLDQWKKGEIKVKESPNCVSCTVLTGVSLCFLFCFVFCFQLTPWFEMIADSLLKDMFSLVSNQSARGQNFKDQNLVKEKEPIVRLRNTFFDK